MLLGNRYLCFRNAVNPLTFQPMTSEKDFEIALLRGMFSPSTQTGSIARETCANHSKTLS